MSRSRHHHKSVIHSDDKFMRRVTRRYIAGFIAVVSVASIAVHFALSITVIITA